MKLTSHILIDAALLWSFLLWQAEGLDGAGNVFLFMAWGLSICGILAALLADGKNFKNQPKHPLIYRVYKKVRSVGIVVAAAWLGMFWLAFAWVAALVLLWGRSQSVAEGGAA